MNRKLLLKLYDMSTSIMHSYDTTWKYYDGDSAWTKCVVCACDGMYKRRFGKYGSWDILGEYFFNTHAKDKDDFFKLIRRYIPMSGIRSMVIENE